MGKKSKAEKAWLAKREEGHRLDKETRWHEAGHALVGIALGRELEVVRVWSHERADGEYFGVQLGQAEFHNMWEDDFENMEWQFQRGVDLEAARLRAWRRIGVLVAGKAAVRVLEGRWRSRARWVQFASGWCGDFQKARRTALLLHPYVGTTVREDEDYPTPEERAHDTWINRHVLNPETHRVYRWLNAHRPHLEAIADALDDGTGRLTGEEANDILADLPPLRRPRWEPAREPRLASLAAA